MKKIIRSRIVLTVVVTLVTYHLSLITSVAQTFTQRIQQDVAGCGRVVLHQDQSIDQLVNGTNSSRPQSNNTSRQNNRNHQADGGQANNNTVVNELTSDTTSVDTHRTRQMMGWRIQAYVGGKTRADRQRAERTGSELRSLFPDHKVYVHFYPPRWTCRLGNFPTQEEAREMLDEVVRMGYDSATMVRERITVPY